MKTPAEDIEVHLVDPGSITFVRLFRYGDEWNPPEEQYRNARVDPPDGHKGEFAVFYLAKSVHVAAAECNVLFTPDNRHYFWDEDLANQYSVVRYSLTKPAIFIPIDGNNRRRLRLEIELEQSLNEYTPYQNVSKELHDRFGTIIHGLSWESFHRNQPGRAFGLWHEHKDTVGLTRPSKPFQKLCDDDEWLQFLSKNPKIDRSITRHKPS